MPTDKLMQYVIAQLEHRGVTIEELANISYHLQIDKVPDLDIADCVTSVYSVLRKREVQNAVMTGIQLDIAAEKHELDEPLQSIIMADEGLYGIDENLALSICNVFGTIGTTNYGYVDRVKTGLIESLDTSEEHCNTFLDDLVGAIAAASAAKLAHGQAGANYAKAGLERAYLTSVTENPNKKAFCLGSGDSVM